MFLSDLSLTKQGGIMAIKKSIMILGFGCALVMNLTGCGKFVTGASAKTYLENGDQYAQADLDLATQGLKLSFDLPIPNPKNPLDPIGRVGMKPIFSPSGGTQLEIAVNLTEAAHLPDVTEGTLPNGRELPIALKPGQTVLTLPIPGLHSVAYVGIGDRFALLGTALILREFDSIAQFLGGTNLFLPFEGQNGIRGVAGVFTSPSPSQSGLAVFVDISSVLKPAARSGLASAWMSGIPASALPRSASERVEFTFGDNSPEAQFLVVRELERLSHARGALHLE